MRHKAKAKVADARLVKVEHFGDVTHLDTLHLTERNGVLVEAEPGDVGIKRLGETLKDSHTKDVEYFPVPNRQWQHVQTALIQFGGSRTGIRQCCADGAPEFKRALNELAIAPIEGTPGRDTSHAIAETGNRQALGRPPRLGTGRRLN